MIVYARHEHGGYRVERAESSLIVHWPMGPVAYRSARSAIRALVNGTPKVERRHKDPRITFDKYFRVGRWGVRPNVDLDVLSLFSIPNPPPRPPGIDLKHRGNEVRKLFYAGFARRIIRYGYDPEEVLQEIYQGLLVRNSGKCPFDPKKSSFGHYVHMVCECIISNYHRKHSRRANAEVFGVVNADGEEIDFAQSESFPPISAPQEDRVGFSLALSAVSRALNFCEGTSQEKEVALLVLPLLAAGCSRSEVVNRLPSYPRNVVVRAIELVRKVSSESI